MLVFTSFFSCKESEVVVDGKKIAVETDSHKYKLNDLFVDFGFTPLKAGDDGFLRNIDKLVLFEDNYYIMDKIGQRKVLVFDDKGNFKRAIGNVGKGKGEYINIEDFTIDKANNRIVILAYPSTVFVYDLQGGFVTSKRLDNNSLLWDIISYKDGFICSSNHSTYTEGEHAFLFYFFNKDFEFVEKRIPVLPKQMQIPPFVSNTFFTDDKGRMLYFDVYTSSVYVIETGKTIEISKNNYILKNQMPYSLFANPNDFASKQLQYDFFIKAGWVDNKLLAFFVGNKKIYGIETDVDADKVNAFEYTGWLPDLMYCKEGFIYSKINARQIEMNKEYFKNIPIDSLLGQAHDIIFKFRYKGIPQ